MNCPACKNPMIVMELEEVEIDHCLSCRGIWLDAEELEILLEDAGAAGKDRLLASFQPVRDTRERPRKCPICLKKMRKILVGGSDPVMIDQCPRLDGLWFDADELERVMALGSLGRDNKVLRLLKDMFGKQ